MGQKCCSNFLESEERIEYVQSNESICKNKEKTKYDDFFGFQEKRLSIAANEGDDGNILPESFYEELSNKNSIELLPKSTPQEQTKKEPKSK